MYIEAFMYITIWLLWSCVLWVYSSVSQTETRKKKSSTVHILVTEKASHHIASTRS